MNLSRNIGEFVENYSRNSREILEKYWSAKGRSMQYANVLRGLALALRDQGSHDESLKVFEKMGKVHDNSGITFDIVDHANHYKSAATIKNTREVAYRSSTRSTQVWTRR